MAKITIGADIKLTRQKFKKGDLVMLSDGNHHNSEYKNRVMIVSKDEDAEGYFTGFCLIDNQEWPRCAASQFELSTKHILLSN